jgi:Flp pilus assembly protein TadD
MPRRNRTRQTSADVARPSGPLGDRATATDVLAVVGLLLLVTATMGRLVAGDFTTWDDYETIAKNPNLNPPDATGLGRLWTTEHMHLYVPVTYTLWWVVAQLAATAPDATTGIALHPAPFHALNVLLHAAATVAVYLLLRRLRMVVWPAVIGAAVFGVHPVQVESVGWISGTKDLLCGLCGVVAVWLYVRAVEPADNKTATVRWRPYALATVVLLVGMLSKPTTMVVPVIAAVVDLLWLRRPVKNVAIALAPWLVLSVACAAVARHVQPPAPIATAGPLQYRPLVALDSLAFYAGKLVAPLAHCVDYGRTPAKILAGGSLWWSWMVPVAIVLAATWVWRRRGDATPLIALAMFLIGLGPILGLVSYDFQGISNVTDHYLYLPMAGVALLVAWGMTRTTAKAWRAVVVVVVVALAARSVVQAGTWMNTRSLFTHVLTVNPDSAAAYNSLASLAVRERRLDDAVALARRGAELDPRQIVNWLTLASAYDARGDINGATEAFGKAASLDPNDPRVLGGLGKLLARTGHPDAALPLLTRAVATDARNPDLRLNLGTLYAQLNRLPEAEQHLRIAVQLDPNNVRGLTNLAIVLRMAGRPGEAVRYLQAALEIDPTFGPARAELGAMRH